MKWDDGLIQSAQQNHRNIHSSAWAKDLDLNRISLPVANETSLGLVRIVFGVKYGVLYILYYESNQGSCSVAVPQEPEILFG